MYQLNKLSKKNYKKLLVKDNTLDKKSQKHICINTIQPQVILVTRYAERKHRCNKKIRNKIITIDVLTIIDEDTSQIEITRITDKISHKIFYILDKEQLYRYLRLEIIVYYNSSEFTKEFKTFYILIQ